MKILLDECLPVDLRHSFVHHDAHTVEWAGLKGKKNGDLMRAAEKAGYQVLITVDHGIPHQEPAHARKLSLVLIRSRTNQIEDLLPLTGAIANALDAIQPGQTITVPKRE